MNFYYPILDVGDNIEAWEKSLEQAIPKILPTFFSKSKRFSWIQSYSSLSLIDYMGIYEEGDWWALTIVKVDFLDKPSIIIFLPITGIISNQLQASDDENIAFGIKTESAFYGIRNWKIIDAFLGTGFLIQLSKLFYKNEDVCDYIDLHKSKIGIFDFHLKNDAPNNLWERKMGIKFLPSGEAQINYENSYSLIFPTQVTSRRLFDLESPNLIGYITYSAQTIDQDFLIAVLQKQ